MRTLALLVALLAIPIALLLVLRVALVDRLDGLRATPEPIVVLAEVAEVADERVAVASLTWGEATILVAPAWQGLVTDVHLAPGDHVTTGTPVVSVDGVRRIAAHTPRPFWRTLDVGDRGEDVRHAQQLLWTLGFLSGSISDAYTEAAARAVARWARSLGDEAPDGSFNPAYVVWLPVPSLEIAAIEIQPGLPAPPAGAVLARGPRPLVEAAILSSTDEPVVLDEPTDWEFVYAGTTYGLAAERVARVRSELLDRLSQAVASDDSAIEGILRRREPVPAILVPASAVTANSRGDFCVWVPSGDGFAARRVTVGEGTINRAQILSGLVGGEAVLANPGTYLLSAECP